MRKIGLAILITVLVTPLLAFSSPTSTKAANGLVARTELILTDNAAAEELRSLPEEWEGVPYRYGGQSRRGIDCSAFVMTVFSEKFGVDIPRSTLYQKEVGISVGRDELQVGDLIIFKSGRSRSSRHVGIYAGNDEFVHISSNRRSGGVKLVNLTDFLNSRSISFLDGRRVIEVLQSDIDLSMPEVALDIENEDGEMHILDQVDLQVQKMQRIASEIKPISMVFESQTLEMPVSISTGSSFSAQWSAANVDAPSSGFDTGSSNTLFAAVYAM